jgi:hypothetical protein
MYNISDASLFYGDSWLVMLRQSCHVKGSTQTCYWKGNQYTDNITFILEVTESVMKWKYVWQSVLCII